ncbi:polysaccharide biosynthesis protein [Bacillus timonensis]|nr:polysaccharide biosynthesis protein [Bacillus timonensis]
MSIRSDRRIGHKVWEGAVVLTVAALFIKILSAGYRVPFQNIVGDIGFYIYQQVYPIYGIVVVLSTYGFPVIISKMIAESYEQGDKHSVKQILYTSFFFLSLFGLISFLVLYFGASVLAQYMGDEELTLLIRIVSLSFLLLPVISLLRGYFQGQRNMIPTAISQVVEQSVRVISILFFSFLLLKQGYSAYYAGAGAIFGSVTGGFIAIFILIYYLFKQRNQLRATDKSVSTLRTRSVVKELFIQGFTICVSGLLLILIQLVDAFSLYSLLLSNGMEETIAKKTKGVYDRGQPLIQLGTVVATSLSLSLVPLISIARARNDFSFIVKKIHLALRISIVVGVGAAFGLASIISPTNIMLFEDNLGSNVIMVLGFSIIFTSLSLTVAAILQGLGYSYIPAISVLLGIGAKWLLNLWLVPYFQTMGAAVASLIAIGLVALLQLIYLKLKMKRYLTNWSYLYSISIAAIIMVLIVTFVLKGIHEFVGPLENSRIMALIQSTIGVSIGGLTYLFIIIKTKVFSKEELLLIPFGEKVQKFFRA